MLYALLLKPCYVQQRKQGWRREEQPNTLPPAVCLAGAKCHVFEGTCSVFSSQNSIFCIFSLFISQEPFGLKWIAILTGCHRLVVSCNERKTFVLLGQACFSQALPIHSLCAASSVASMWRERMVAQDSSWNWFLSECPLLLVACS